jgi:hypothetical protein
MFVLYFIEINNSTLNPDVACISMDGWKKTATLSDPDSSGVSIIFIHPPLQFHATYSRLSLR